LKDASTVLGSAVMGNNDKNKPNSNQGWLKSSPDSFKYVIIGGGTAAYNATRGIREADPDGEILIITEEAHPPYRRPPLSKINMDMIDYSLSLTGPKDDTITNKDNSASLAVNKIPVYYAPMSEYENITDKKSLKPTGSGIKLLQNTKAVDLDVYESTVELDDGKLIRFDRLLLATGHNPKKLSSEPAKSRVLAYHNIDDHRRLMELLHEKNSTTKSRSKIAVVGGEILGTELTTSLSKVASVTMLLNRNQLLNLFFRAIYQNGLLEWLRHVVLK
jgi:apoptosis-inducing factor 1